MVNSGKVYLVGAGPGDPELITVKGINCIKKAEVIIYDHLVAPELIKEAKHNCELIYVGKKSSLHTLKQEEINSLLIKKAKEGKIVVRLKGGDPFLFGRGGEEAEKLASENISFEIVPGITSALACPAYAGIPVTHRKFASSVAILTGHEDPKKLSSKINWQKISTGVDTLIFLMGRGNLKFIVEQLMENGRDPNSKIALIQWGTTSEQKTLVGNLKDILKKVKKEKFEPPVVIVIGEVINLREKLSWFEKRPFFDQKILVTRATEQASSLVKLLKEKGARVKEFPVIKIVPFKKNSVLDKVVSQISSYDWIIFTSSNGVKFFFDRFFYLNKNPKILSNIKFCAIGPNTKSALGKLGIKVDKFPEKFTSDGILNSFKREEIKGKKFLLARSNIAPNFLPNKLKEKGGIVEDIKVYKTLIEKPNFSNLKEKIDFITFTSSSTVKNFVKLLGKKESSKFLKKIKIVSIGPVTSKTIKKLGFNPDVEAKVHTIEGMVEAICTGIKFVV